MFRPDHVSPPDRPRCLLYASVAALLLLLPATLRSHADEPRITLVAVTPQLALPGTDLRVVVRIDPHTAARLLQVTVDAQSYYASTDRQLDGDEAPVAHTFTWRDLPAGRYTIRATLQSVAHPDAEVTRTMTVLGGPEAIDPGATGRRP